MELSTPAEVTVDVMRAVELAVCLAAAVVLWPRWRARRGASAGSALAVFVILVVILALGWWEPEDTGSTAILVYQKVVVLALLALPVLLVRFARDLGGVGRLAWSLTAGLYAVEAVATLVAPRFPEPDAPRPDWVIAYTVLVLAAWGVQSAVAGLSLWRAGRGQRGVVRSRMRSLGLGTVLLALTFITSSAAGAERADWAVVVTTGLGLVSILLVAVAFVAPAWLRTVWRQPDLQRLAEVELGLLRLLDPDGVAAVALPPLARVYGDGAAALVGRGGELHYVEGPLASRLADQVPALPSSPADGAVVELDGDVLGWPLRDGWLLVLPGRLAPVFAADDALLIQRVGTLVDLTLTRVASHEQERRARTDLEKVNAELQQFIYSVSHDLRSPVISVLGYLDLLLSDHGGELSEEARHFLDRIESNATYMQDLIHDLLELSRVGRVDVSAERVPLAGLAAEVAESLQVQHPAATVVVDADLPEVLAPALRVRQVLTNLLDNAATHSGRDDVTITVDVERTADGGARLRVADDGQGVPEAYREKIFEVFQRLEAGRGKSRGTGMGLTITRRVVESLGGSVRLTARDDGTGTVVLVELPAEAVLSWPAPTPAPAMRGRG